jgi:hypothetical protein
MLNFRLEINDIIQSDCKQFSHGWFLRFLVPKLGWQSFTVWKSDFPNFDSRHIKKVKALEGSITFNDHHESGKSFTVYKINDTYKVSSPTPEGQNTPF